MVPCGSKVPNYKEFQGFHTRNRNGSFAETPRSWVLEPVVVGHGRQVQRWYKLGSHGARTNCWDGNGMCGFSVNGHNVRSTIIVQMITGPSRNLGIVGAVNSANSHMLGS